MTKRHTAQSRLALIHENRAEFSDETQTNVLSNVLVDETQTNVLSNVLVDETQTNVLFNVLVDETQTNVLSNVLVTRLKLMYYLMC
ncbi:hypothetical protein RRG08_039454 [Elysia crispata]|uniref:Uncharacterized protein n=1 Tax=Elysia crispata TaxID=231223 RepID=A0AAE1D014_9GAST|nr:hypothetical protein RRG08_039454 [Elysia crispata]